MAAKGKAFCKAQRSLQGSASILKSAACEWLLIFLMLIDALLSYVLTKFAHICNLQTPCILCYRLDHLLGKEKPTNYRNLLCINHRLEISSLVSCNKHNKLVDGNEMCDACLCSFATTNNKPKSTSKMQRLIVGKLRSDTGGNGAHGKLLNRDSIPHCIKTKPCSCCSKPWKSRPNAQGLLQMKSSGSVATKPNIHYPRRLNSRDSLKKMRDKIFGSVTLEHPGKTGFNLLSNVGYGELRITSDSELEDLLSEEDDDKSLICEKSELKEDSVLQSITQIPLKAHCNNCDQVKPSINFVDSRPSPLESYVQVDVQKPHDVESVACDATFHRLNKLNWLPWPVNPTANPSTWAELISLDDASSPASNALGLCYANSMEKSELTDSLNQESTLPCSPEFTTLHHDPQVVGKLTTSEVTGTDNMEIASLNELQDHSTLIITKVEECSKIDEVVNESSLENTNDATNHNIGSESSESDKEHTNHNSDSETSESDKEPTNHNSDSDSESSESDKEHEVNFSTRQPSEKETDIVTNDLKQPPLISTTVEECSKTNEEVYESAIKNINDDDMDHSSASEFTEIGKEQEVFNFTTSQPLDTEIDLVTNDMKQSPLINTTVEKCPKIDEVVYVYANRNTIDDMDHINVSGSSKSEKEQEVFNFAIEQSSKKETDIVTNDLKPSPLITTTVEEYPKIDEVAYEYAIKNTNDDMDHSNTSESFESGKELEIFNFATRQSSEKETDIVTDDLKSSPLISKTIEECPKTDEMTYEFAIKNTNDDMDHSNVSESFESGKEHEIFNFATRQSLEKETDNLKSSPLISKIVEECPKTDEVAYEYAIKNTNDDIDHNNALESFKSGKEHEIFNFATRQSSEETDIVIDDLKSSPLISKTVEECPKIDEVTYESAINNTNDDVDHNNALESFESGKEHEIFNFGTRQSSEKETDIVTDDLKSSPLISKTVEECPKTDEVAYESHIKNTNDDTDHSNALESFESGKEHEIFNFATRQSSEKETDIVTDDLKLSSLISKIVEECPKTDEVAYESAIKNINDDMDHSNIRESSESDNEHKIFNFAIGQSSEKETELVTNDLEHSPLISTIIEKCSTTDEVVYESAIMNSNDDMDHSNVSESFGSDKQQGVCNFATEQPLKTEPDIVTNDMEQFSLQNSPVEFVNQSSSDDAGQNFNISYDDLQEEFSSEFNIIRAFDRSASMESVESQDGSNVSEIEGENLVDRLKRQVEYDKKCINSLYKEFEEERNASEVAASQAMAMITRLQEEKAAMHMEALHYLRMMEEQAEYDVEALEKANELLNEKEREIQDLETEVEYYRSNYLVNTIVETEHEKSDEANEEQSDGAKEENITAENDIAKRHEYNGNYSFKSTIVEASKGSYRSLNNQTSSLEFEDEKIYIQLCLKSLEDKINKIFANGLLARVPNCIDIGEEVNPEQKGEESIDAERSQRNSEENDPSMHIGKDTCNGTVTPEEELVNPDNNDHFGSEENFPIVKVQISCANKREEVDFLALEHKISDLTGRLEALQADYDFLEHSLNSLRYGEEGLQFAQNIVHQLQELCKLGIRLDRQPGS